MNRWPAQECLHEHVTDECRITDGAGRVLRVDPATCLDCGAEQPIEGDGNL